MRIVNTDDGVGTGENRLARGGEKGDGSREPVVGTRWAKGPSGMLREDSVQPTQLTSERSVAVTARARVDLPTPAAPVSTTPPPVPPVNVERTESNSAGRSSNCHRLAMSSECKCPRRVSRRERDPRNTAVLTGMIAWWRQHRLTARG